MSLPDTTAIPVLMQELIDGKEIWMPFIAFVSQSVNTDQTRNIALALYTEAGFETDGTDFVYYGHPIANWQCSVRNGNIACVTNNQTDEAERAHVVFPYQITKVISLSPTCIVEVQGGNQIPVDPCFIHVPGFFHVDGDRDKPYLFTDLTKRTSCQEEYIRLRNLWEEFANSEANHGHVPGSNEPDLIDTAVNTDGLTTPQGTALPESNGMTDVLACVKGNILNEVDRLTGTGLLKACGANVALGGKERALHRVGSNPLTIPHFQSQPVTTKVDKSDKWFSYTYNAAQRVVQKYRSLTSFDVQTENWSKYEKTQLTFVLLVSDMQFSDSDPAILLERAVKIVDRRRIQVSFQTMWTNLKKKHNNFFEKNPLFVKLTKQEVETLEMLFEQQELPAPAANGHALGGMLQQDLSAEGRDCIDLTIDSPRPNGKPPAPSDHELSSMQVDPITETDSGDRTPITSPDNFNPGGVIEDEDSLYKSRMSVMPPGSPDQGIEVYVTLGQMQVHQKLLNKDGTDEEGLPLVDVCMLPNGSCAATYMYNREKYTVIIPDTRNDEKRKEYFRCFEEKFVFLLFNKKAASRQDEDALNNFWWYWRPRELQDIFTDHNDFWLVYNSNADIAETELHVSLTSDTEDQRLAIGYIVWTCNVESLSTLKTYLEARFDNGSDEQKKAIDNYIALVEDIWGATTATALRDGTLAPRQDRSHLQPVGLGSNEGGCPSPKRPKKFDPNNFLPTPQPNSPLCAPQSRSASPQLHLMLDEDSQSALNGGTVPGIHNSDFETEGSPGVIHPETISGLAQRRKDIVSQYVQFTKNNSSIADFELKVRLCNVYGKERIDSFTIRGIVTSFDEQSIHNVHNLLISIASLPRNAMVEFEEYVRLVRTDVVFYPDSESEGLNDDGSQNIWCATNQVQPEDMALDEMPDEELQQRLAEVEEKEAELQRTLHKCGRHTKRLKKAIRKRKQRKKFDAQKKFKKNIHEALEREHSNRIAVMKKRYEQRLAAKTIQAVAQMQMARMQYQKDLLAWNNMQNAMQLAMEAEHAAEEAASRAQRLREEADKAARMCKRLKTK